MFLQQGVGHKYKYNKTNPDSMTQWIDAKPIQFLVVFWVSP